MIAEIITTLTSFISAHPHWIGFAVFAATAVESMAFIGSLFPGMSIVLALSGIAASLGADIWLLVLWCTMGAIVGDGASYWLGHRFGDDIKTMWPFRRHPEFLDKGTEFFLRNGGRSIVVGRFLPFTRAVVPIAAGMLGMSPVKFYIANILSAIGWALMNVVPAAGAGLAFAAINQASSRVASMLGLFIAIFVIALLAGHTIVRLVLPRLDRGIFQLAEKLKHGPKWATGITTLFFGSGSRPATTSVAWLILISGLVLSFAKILEDIVSNDPLVRMDVAVNALIQGFRSPIGDQIMTALTLMGDTTVILWACAALVGGLLISRAWRTAGMTVLVLVTTAAFVPLLKWTLDKPRPIDLHSGADVFSSFPGGHAAFSAVLWGLIAVIGSRALSRKTQATVWASAFTLSMLVGLSRIYLSVHWPSDVIGGLLFGWVMASLFGLFEERIREPIARPGLVGLMTSITLILAWGFHGTVSFEQNLARYQPRRQVVSVSLRNWIEGGWKQISPARIDLKGEYEEPLTFQAAVPLGAIETALKSAGWRRSPTMEWRRATQFFGGQKQLGSLDTLPLLHNGTPPLLTMIATSLGEDHREVFRLWRTGVEIEDRPGRPVLVGSLTQERVTHPFVGINILRDIPSLPNTIHKVVALLVAGQRLCLLPSSLADPTGNASWLIVSRGNSWCPEKAKSTN